MNKKFVLLVFASLLPLSAVIGSQLIVSVAAQSVGVSVDDWAEYAATVSGNGTLPPEMNITWAKFTVQEISGTNITFQQIVRYPDTSEATTINVVDVATGQGNGTGLFIAKDLIPGNLIYTDPPDDRPEFEGATINETIYRAYPVGNVEVNHLNLTFSDTIPGWGTQNGSINYYWYKATGMMAEMSIYIIFQPSEGNTTWAQMEAVIIGVIPEFPPALIIPLFMITTLAAVWLGKMIWSTKKSIKKPSPCA